jgi:hypothetical protein
MFAYKPFIMNSFHGISSENLGIVSKHLFIEETRLTI